MKLKEKLAFCPVSGDDATLISPPTTTDFMRLTSGVDLGLPNCHVGILSNISYARFKQRWYNAYRSSQNNPIGFTKPSIFEDDGSRSFGRLGFITDTFRVSEISNSVAAIVRAPGGNVTAKGTIHMYKATRDRAVALRTTEVSKSSRGFDLICKMLSIPETGRGRSLRSRHSICAKQIPTLPSREARNRAASMREVAVT
jgi:hypothetical protein